MRKIIALLVAIGVSVGGFLWWKRQQVIAANEVSADPWPAAVAPVAPVSKTAVELPIDTKPQPKKSTAKKAPSRKATQEPD